MKEGSYPKHKHIDIDESSETNTNEVLNSDTVLRRDNQMVKPTINRSSHQRCSIKKDLLRNFTKFTGIHLCQSLFFNKVAGLVPESLF